MQPAGRGVRRRPRPNYGLPAPTGLNLTRLSHPDDPFLDITPPSTHTLLFERAILGGGHVRVHIADRTALSLLILAVHSHCRYDLATIRSTTRPPGHRARPDKGGADILRLDDNLSTRPSRRRCRFNAPYRPHLDWIEASAVANRVETEQ